MPNADELGLTWAEKRAAHDRLKASAESSNPDDLEQAERDEAEARAAYEQAIAGVAEPEVIDIKPDVGSAIIEPDAGSAGLTMA